MKKDIRNPIGQNVKRCATIGLGMDLVYSAWVAVLYVLRGSAPFDRLSTSLGNVVLFYVCIGPICGAIVGLMWPLAKVRVGAYLTSIIASAFLAFGIYFSLQGWPQKWDIHTWMAFPLLTLIFGFAFGNSLWKAASQQ